MIHTIRATRDELRATNNRRRVTRDERQATNLFMQNKPNLPDNQMNVSSVKTKGYEDVRLFRRGENKAKQSQFQTWPCLAQNGLGHASKLKSPSSASCAPSSPLCCYYTCLESFSIQNIGEPPVADPLPYISHPASFWLLYSDSWLLFNHLRKGVARSSFKCTNFL